MLGYTHSIEVLRVMVAIVLDYRNLFEILKSIDIVESYMYGCHSAWVLECMRGRTECQGSIYKSTKLDCHCAWLTMHLHGYYCMHEPHCRECYMGLEKLLSSV